MKIGVFDSGLGGLVIAKALMEALPKYDYVYYGDTVHVPYGEKTPGRILAYTLDAMRFLIRQNCGLIIIACNTATAITLRYLQKRFCPKFAPDVKILGVIIPTVEEALKNGEKMIGVVGTPTTIRSDIYAVELKKILPNVQVVSLSTPRLVPAIENNDFIGAEKAIAEYSENFNDIPALILGCTHYPLVKGLFQQYLPNTRIIAQDELMGQKLFNYLKHHKEIETKLSRGGTRQFFVSQLSPSYTQVAQKLFPNIQLERI
ncbi:MAG: glutamate racemase [Alphaproteobacteria bacterium]|nr:glutamate racemase [Alphaproteobacteria bacterium]